MIVLGIESSCDETGVAIYDGAEQKLLAHQLYSQIALHAQYGGVVPELASRDHIRKLPLLVNAAIEEAGINLQDLEGIAFTRGPGLIGALMVAATYAQGLGLALDIPILGVNHMEAHLMAVMLEEQKPEYPFVTLLVSGGHTQLVLVRDFGNYELLGESLDDAVGEAFDKTAKIMGLPYPGGPELAKLAEAGDPSRYHFPRPMLNRPGLEFSFSGIKTKALLTIEEATEADYPDIAAAFQEALVDTLIQKSLRALKRTGAKNLVVSGGVGANKHLRSELKRLSEEKGFQVYFPRSEFCTDNGAMVAYLGCERLSRGEQSESVKLLARWPIDQLTERASKE
ncbi:tRNA (adenosine(37)-N6)-threonylcarbamoyltransferase complex transferase subunit TsaD [Ignatzschineria cameli]|uniref:tRNA N6-adenosine threonylcarbamoyltransferase n=1 Tax=Ignatzschineria cameli TaxID=2182793 RepID=A0A2U2ASV7_9GAMM|nr:tRNA (adenosine(37)-N6)-threonylcarbamoyltransferase complex transferase subunit TsaD [Ignatzschineria cameli]PWD85971.1 tRNA (adenosine(37)-N6)-threonylcarbamoyltransferase complex transferase subunit TsaD [Ignatzschineria cameli]PWD87819.1 tRNA (adenosine(37)-N6)-threonylcarbamoyltransferase complex transferase subunit TsaD [Ignatzschineria cameli]PWD90388.1 tRNA (adenosine(37)-N6)-threonylcarbamoyltransferase complex transferase subunit TsaD [Ignatzschineria cameli]PWD92271.1 tRNA (adenos